MPSTIECPLCKKTLNAPEGGDGQQVRCPACYGVFTLDAPAGVSAAPVNQPTSAEANRRRQALQDEAEARRRRDRYREDDDAYDGFDDIRDRQRPVAPHRGGLIQTLGILSIVFCCIPFVGGILGLLGFIFGQSDMAAIDAGRMDRAGRSITQGGRTCAIIGLVLSIAFLALYVVNRVVRF
jgi:hypothetical protein